MSSLATKAFALSKKPTKKRAMKIVEELSYQLGASDELAELYSYFKPTTPAKPKSPREWVCKAMGKNDIRAYLNRLEVADGVMVATDGHRVHTCNTSLRNGAYDNQFNRIDEAYAGKYPDWKRVIPTNANRPGAINLSQIKIVERHTSIEGKTIGGGKTTIEGDFIGVQFGDVVIHFNNKYWNDAVSQFNGKAMVRYGTGNESILITETTVSNGTVSAVIMPVRV